MAPERSSVTGRTTLLAILADPVAQARTPALVNALLAAHGVDAVLVPLRVGRDALEAVVRALRMVPNFAGAVVSMPNKEAILPFVDALTPEAAQVGAANVVRRLPDGRLEGTMLDGEGFVAGLRAAGHAVASRRALLVGAGGAGAGIAFALAKHGVARLTIHNRTAARARALATRVAAAFPSVRVEPGSADVGAHDLVVNATSLGMRPDDPMPIDLAGLAPGAIVADVVIHPDTPLLGAAAARGAITHSGGPMLESQIELMVAFMLAIMLDSTPAP